MPADSLEEVEVRAVEREEQGVPMDFEIHVVFFLFVREIAIGTVNVCLLAKVTRVVLVEAVFHDMNGFFELGDLVSGHQMGGWPDAEFSGGRREDEMGDLVGLERRPWAAIYCTGFFYYGLVTDGDVRDLRTRRRGAVAAESGGAVKASESKQHISPIKHVKGNFCFSGVGVYWGLISIIRGSTGDNTVINTLSLVSQAGWLVFGSRVWGRK